MSKKNINTNLTNSFSILELIIKMFLFIAILFYMFNNFKTPIINYLIINNWEKTNGVIYDKYSDNNNIIIKLFDLLYKLDYIKEGKGYVLDLNESESNPYSREIVKYEINKEELIGKSIHSYLFNFNKDEKVVIYYNPKNTNEIMINTKYRLYIDPIIGYIINFLLIYFFLLLFFRENKSKIKE